MSRFSITIDKEGVQILSFLGKTPDERKKALEIYSIVEDEIRVLEQTIKDHFSENESDPVRIWEDTKDGEQSD